MLLNSRQAYWVEDIDYNPPACRFLLTERDYGTRVMGKLTHYDPTKRNGPWWHDKKNDIHYRNGNVTLEFMIDDPLNISDCSTIKFVDHHKYQCCIDPKTCQDKDLHHGEGSARYVAGCLERNIHLPRKAIVDENGQVASTYIDSALYWLCRLFKENLEEEEFLGTIVADDPIAMEIARVMLSCLVSEDRFEAGLKLAILFANKKELERTVFKLAEEHLRVNFKEKKRIRWLS
jgi:hypothetical protein